MHQSVVVYIAVDLITIGFGGQHLNIVGAGFFFRSDRQHKGQNHSRRQQNTHESFHDQNNLRLFHFQFLESALIILRPVAKINLRRIPYKSHKHFLRIPPPSVGTLPAARLLSFFPRTSYDPLSP